MQKPLLTAVILAGLLPQTALAQATPATGPVAAVSERLGLSEVSVYRQNRYGWDLHGQLADGAWVRVEIDRAGVVEEVEGDGQGAFAASAIAPLLPREVLESADYLRDGLIYKIEFDDDGQIEIEGRRADGRDYEAEFARDGRLLELKLD
jgi:hypothetical protein